MTDPSGARRRRQYCREPPFSSLPLWRFACRPDWRALAVDICLPIPWPAFNPSCSCFQSCSHTRVDRACRHRSLTVYSFYEYHPQPARIRRTDCHRPVRGRASGQFTADATTTGNGCSSCVAKFGAAAVNEPATFADQCNSAKNGGGIQSPQPGSARSKRTCRKTRSAAPGRSGGCVGAPE